MEKSGNPGASLIRTAVVPVLWGFVGGVLFFGCLLTLLAFLFSALSVPLSSFPFGAFFAAAGGTFFGGFIAARKGKRRGFIFGGAVGALLFLTALAIGWGVYPSVRSAPVLLRLFLFLCAGVCGGILGVGSKRR